MYKSPDIVTEIKVRRLEWLGHVVRMEDTRLPKMVFNGKPDGRRGFGRPRLRWLDDVEADIKALGVKRWRIKAQDRKEWSAILREAKAKLKGP
jgi:transcription termination factor 2